MTFTQVKLFFHRITRQMWFRATIYCLLGIAAALLGVIAQPLIPADLPGKLGANSVGNLLTILATSMLAVTTFSLSTMVSAYSSAATSATPRATRLLIADSSAQGALATFIGAFLFSVVGLIALSTGLYGESGRVILFAATILVIVLITVTLLAWIEKLSSFGRLATTVNLVEKVTRRAIETHADDPFLGAAPGAGRPTGALPVESSEIGYVEYADIERLAVIACEADLEIDLAARPGAFVAPGQPLVWITGGQASPKAIDCIRKAFTISNERSFEQDSRFGFVVLAEVGSRALSPSTNDPGTAIDVIGTVTRLLCGWARSTSPEPVKVKHPRVFVPAMEVADLFDDIYPSLARDGAHMLEVGLHLQKSLAAVAAAGNETFARVSAKHASDALARGLQSLAFAPDRERLQQSIRQLESFPGHP